MVNTKIPKTIHYSWFGGNPIPEKLKKCLDSWKTFLPDYKIIEWNESNSDLDVNTYVRQAYDEKKYAFVSDYIRFHVLYTHGGVYLDTDVEVLKSFDPLLNDQGFVGYEGVLIVGPDTMGAVKGNPIIKESLDGYIGRSFINEDGTYDYTPISSYMTKFFAKRGLVRENRIQIIDGFKVYPVEYFHPLDFWTKKLNITNNTYSVHMWAESWKSFPERIKTQFHRIIGDKLMKRLSKIKKWIKRLLNKK